MRIKTLSIAVIVSLVLFVGCIDKKKTKENVEVEVISENKKEVIEVDEDEKRRLDSIHQVKEHGHAH